MKKILLLFLFCLVLLHPWRSMSQTTVIEKDSLALVSLYNATNGPSWKNNTSWLTLPVKNWYGIELTENRVNSIQLQSNNSQFWKSTSQTSSKI